MSLQSVDTVENAGLARVEVVDNSEYTTVHNGGARLESAYALGVPCERRSY